MNTLALLLIGYSLFSALGLAMTHFRRTHYPQVWPTRVIGWSLLLALSILQVSHLAWLHFDQAWVESAIYRMVLFAVAPCFYLLSHSVLRDEASPALRNKDWVHFMPVALAWLLPSPWALPLAFVVGAVYLVGLGKSMLALRAHRAHFGQEILALGAVFVIAVGVAVLGVMQAQLPGQLFYVLYASAIGLAFFLVQIALGMRPALSEQVQESAQSGLQAYVTTTLAHVDCDAAIRQLEDVMTQRHLYTDPELKLAGLAQSIGLSGHQLSELLNTRIGKSFARYLREQRVEAAKTMLDQEPKASVLSVGLSVGFVSQSSFYDAFRELEGMTPGQFRQIKRKSAADALT
jgi:AraC-like DNA-binding protein